MKPLKAKYKYMPAKLGDFLDLLIRLANCTILLIGIYIGAAMEFYILSIISFILFLEFLNAHQYPFWQPTEIVFFTDPVSGEKFSGAVLMTFEDTGIYKIECLQTYKTYYLSGSDLN